MKHLLLATLALAAIGTVGSACAADLPLKAPVLKAPVVAPWDWTGFYVGLNLGYSWGRSDTTETLTNTAGAFLATGSSKFDLNGVIGGGQIGHNWQSGRWVYGLEADIQWPGQKGSLSFLCPTGVCTAPFAGGAAFPGPAVAIAMEQKLAWFGTVRGRLGAAVTPTVLVYVSGGLAYGEVDTTATLTAGANTAALSASTTKAGWTVGAGVEGVVTGNWTAKAEYLYIDLGTVTASLTTTIPALGGGTIVATSSSNVTDNIFRVGVNRKF